MTGDPSHNPDSPSEASCPAGYDVIDCKCDVESDDCDGTQVDGNTCKAIKASSGSPVRVRFSLSHH